MSARHYNAEARLRELAEAFGNRRDVRVEWIEFGGTTPMWSVYVNNGRAGQDEWRRLGYDQTMNGAIEDAFESIERAKAQTLLDSPDFDLHY